ncbi:DNA alkylation repair protein [Agromyces protaetiae]|uniref:DNA alkylation repair protein n=1 Tax=Agromyces protaetiae TaxID=2509455 RepID=UPI001AA087DE|nr:DNA alkylation repair protein [Agromyces protaetiae]
MTATDASAPTALDVVRALDERADPVRAAGSQGFFKTGPGEYGEGDVFLGVTVPATRAVAKRFADLPQAEIDVLLESPVHEHRLCGLVVMVDRFRSAGRPRTRDDALRLDLHRAYLAHVRAGRVDNWDLVDASAEYLVGGIFYEIAPVPEVMPALVAEFAASDSLWERRVATLATFAAIKAGDSRPALAVAEVLVGDREDLIRKAVGWMLREVGKRVSLDDLLGFLDEYAARVPRTMLSYATEHLSAEQRAGYRAMR